MKRAISLVFDQASSLQRLTTLKCQRLTSNEDEIGAFVLAFHLELTRLSREAPAGTTREIQACRLIRSAVHVFGAKYTVTIRDRKVQQAPLLILIGASGLRSVMGKAIDPLDGAEQSFPHGSMREAIRHIVFIIWIIAGFLEAVQENGKSPLAVCAAVDSIEPPFIDAHGQRPLGMLPIRDVPIVHPHQVLVGEWVAVRVG